MPRFRLKIKTEPCEAVEATLYEFSLYYGRKRLGKMVLEVNRYNIYVGDLHIFKIHRGRGYGSLMLNFAKVISEMTNKPIFLYAINDTEEFYRKNGFIPISEIQDRIIVVNSDPSRPPIVWESGDMIWLPSSLKKGRSRISIIV